MLWLNLRHLTSTSLPLLCFLTEPTASQLSSFALALNVRKGKQFTEGRMRFIFCCSIKEGVFQNSNHTWNRGEATVVESDQWWTITYTSMLLSLVVIWVSEEIMKSQWTQIYTVSLMGNSTTPPRTWWCLGNPPGLQPDFKVQPHSLTIPDLE